MTTKKISSLLAISCLFSLLVLGGLGCKKEVNTGGIFKSTNKGETWERKVFIKEEDKKQITIGALEINKIIQDNLNQNSFFLATSNGIYGTDNGGENWIKIALSGSITDLDIDPTNSSTLVVTQGNLIFKTQENFAGIDNIYTNPDNSNVVSIIIDTYNPQRYFAATKSGLLIVSQDGGQTWSTLNQFNQTIKKIVQAKSDTRVLYAITAKSLFMSTDAGNSWEEISTGLKEFSKAKYINHIAIDPTNYAHFYLATDFGILESLNGGQTYEPLKTLVATGVISIQSIFINPNNINELYFPVNRVIHKSTDRGLSWETIEAIESTGQVNYIIVDKNDSNIIYAGLKPITK